MRILWIVYEFLGVLRSGLRYTEYGVRVWFLMVVQSIGTIQFSNRQFEQSEHNNVEWEESRTRWCWAEASRLRSFRCCSFTCSKWRISMCDLDKNNRQFERSSGAFPGRSRELSNIEQNFGYHRLHPSLYFQTTPSVRRGIGLTFSYPRLKPGAIGVSPLRSSGIRTSYNS